MSENRKTLHLSELLFQPAQSGISILNLTYVFDKNTQQSEKVITFRLDKKIKDLTDSIRDIENRIKNFETANTQDVYIITRLEKETGSVLVVGSKWYVKYRGLGSSFILGNNATGSVDLVGGIELGTLGSKTGSVSFLGDSRGEFTVFASGGYEY